MICLSIRRLGSIKTELLQKSREAVLAAVQIFNSPSITFKAETFIVLAIIAWTYLMHAYYRQQGIDYRYFDQKGIRKRYHKTKHGAYKHWELERCLNETSCPLDKNTKNNLRFLIGLRHEIEHQMTTRIDDIMSAKFQACCLNFNDYIQKLFTNETGIEKHLAFSLQFSTISAEQKDLLEEHPNLPKNIEGFLDDFETILPEDEFKSQKYAYRILFVSKIANRKGQADRVIEFIKSDSPFADTVNKEYALIKETEKPKYLASQIVKIMKDEGFSKFNVTHHTRFWQGSDAKNSSKGLGSIIAGKQWYWYEKWVEEVRRHCQSNREVYT